MRRLALLSVFVFALVVAPTRARAGNPLVVFPERPERFRALRYHAEDSEQCLAELAVRGVPFTHGPRVPTIDTPVRLTGPLRGVVFEMHHPTVQQPKEGPVMDCRLLLGLDDLALVVADRGVARVRYNSIHRGRWAQRRGWRHAAGVAVDIVEFVQRDAQVLNVLRDFEGHGVGSRTCGEGAPAPRQPKARALRALVCAFAELGTFNLILSPHYDRRHKDHLHLEVRRGIDWFLTQ
ncbi:MAG: extensin family protein [Myxococcales bacterium]|nr:extensin family protein [Myxococcales bacterium]